MVIWVDLLQAVRFDLRVSGTELNSVGLKHNQKLPKIKQTNKPTSKAHRSDVEILGGDSLVLTEVTWSYLKNTPLSQVNFSPFCFQI